MSGSTSPPVERTPAEWDAARSRITRRIGLIGVVVAVALALVTGASGGSGQAGMVVFLLTLALTTAAAGLWATGTLLLDDLKKRRPSKRRIAVAVGLFLATGVLMAMVVGAGAAT